MSGFYGRRRCRGCLVGLVAALLCSVSPVIAAGGTTTYSYDALGRLTQVTYANGVTVIYALDAAGNRTKVTTTQPPPAPGTLTISSITASTATATWTASSGGTAPTGYEYTLNGGTTWTSVGTALSASLTGLTDNGTQYTFSVRASDAEGGWGTESSTSFSTAPSAPGSVTITNLGDTTATASWGAATDHAGTPDYEYTLNGGTSWNSVGTALTVNLTGLTTTVKYTFSVRAYDAAGTRGASSSATFTTPDTIPPSAPGTPTFSNVAGTSATASWSAATDNVGVSGYEYIRTGQASWTKVGNVLSVNLTGLTGDTAYTFSVRAYDAAGNIGSSSSKSFTTAVVYPSTPTGLKATTAGNTQINLSWSPTSDTGGPGLAGYHVYRNGSEIGSTASTSFSDTGVSVFNTYSYTVAAYDTKGITSAKSSAVSGSTFYTITNSSGSSISSLYGSSITVMFVNRMKEYYWHINETYGSLTMVLRSDTYPSSSIATLCQYAGTYSIASGYERSGCIVKVEPSVYGH